MIYTESIPMKGVPDRLSPFRIPTLSPALNEVFWVLKWHTKSSSPSPFTSSPFELQKAKLCSSPVGPKAKEGRSTSCTASKDLVERIATGIFPLLFGLMLFGNSPGLISIKVRAVEAERTAAERPDKAPNRVPENC